MKPFKVVLTVAVVGSLTAVALIGVCYLAQDKCPFCKDLLDTCRNAVKKVK